MSEALLTFVRDGLLVAVWVALPLVIGALVGGVVAAALGAVAQLNDPSISLVLRVVAFVAAIAIFGPTIAARVTAFGSSAMALVGALGESPS